VTALLIVVALADLSQHERFSPESPRSGDAAAGGIGPGSPKRTNQS
jgi:hypothetical protein